MREQTLLLVNGLCKRLTTNLVGIYLHGSLAMGCFSLAQSDIDLLIVNRRRMPLETKHAVAKFLLGTSGAPSPVEISILSEADLEPWLFPTPFDFHFSEMWRESIAGDLAIGEWRRWNEPPRSTRRDPDLAAHISAIRARGVVLSGKPAVSVFPLVPRADLVAALVTEVESFEDADIDTVLNACRLLAYLREDMLLSKDEGGRWALRMLPGGVHPVIEQALNIYHGGAVSLFDRPALDHFASHMRADLAELTPQLPREY